MPGAYLWGWDYDAEDWVKVRVDDTGKLIIGSGTIEVEQDTPADLQATVTPASGAEFLNYPRIPDGATQVVKSVSAVLNTTSVIHPVTEGTTFYLCEWAVSSLTTVGGGSVALKVRNASALDLYTIGLIGYNAGNLGGQIVGDPLPPIEIPELYDIALYSDTAAIYGYAFIFGYEI